ncbi:hypothetical protein vBKpnAMK4_00510 [Klebsiella phage vB_Kpn_AM_K4]
MEPDKNAILGSLKLLRCVAEEAVKGQSWWGSDGTVNRKPTELITFTDENGESWTFPKSAAISVQEVLTMIAAFLGNVHDSPFSSVNVISSVGVLLTVPSEPYQDFPLTASRAIQYEPYSSFSSFLIGLIQSEIMMRTINGIATKAPAVNATSAITLEINLRIALTLMLFVNLFLTLLLWLH